MSASSDAWLHDTVRAYDSNPQGYAQQWDNFVPASHDKDMVGLLAETLPTGARVLDLGSGSGRDLKRMQDLGLCAQGLDVSEGLARIARQYAPVIIGDMRCIPFAQNTFDGVLAAASLLHLPVNEVPVALSEIKRVLRPRGILAMVVKGGAGELKDDAGRFFHLYDDKTLDARLSQAGFTVTHRATDVDAARDTTWLIRVAIV